MSSVEGFVIGADGFSLPVAALTQRIVVLGQSGSGKSNTVTDLVEEVLARGLQVIVVDYKGDFWGLQSSADGKHVGYDVVTLGGDHGDLELHEDSGRTVADLIVSDGFSAILDLSNFESRESMRRFITAFAKRLFFLKKDKPTPVLLVLDEVDQYAAQRPIQGEQIMLGAIETLVRLGRKRGIGVTMTTQAPAIVSKNVIEQGDLYIFHQIAGKNAVKAIEEAIKRNATEEELREISRNIGRLQVGEAFVYSPAWLRILQAVKMRRRRTFDSGRTPQVGDTVLVPTARAKPDIPALRAQIEATIERAKADDPKVLRARIAELERELCAKPAQAPAVPPERVEVPVLSDADKAVLANVMQATTLTAAAVKKSTDILETLAGIQPTLEAMVDHLRTIQEAANGKRSAPLPAAPRTFTPTPRPPRETRQSSSPASTGALGSGPMKILYALAAKRDGSASRSQLAFLAGFAPTGGTFGTYLSRLRSANAIEDAGSNLAITDVGRTLAGDVPPAPKTTADVLGMFMPKLQGGPRKIFEQLVAVWPRGLSRDELANRAGFEARGGTYGTYLSRLRSAEVMEGSAELRAVDELFPTGAPR